jgi:hypothetical protein
MVIKNTISTCCAKDIVAWKAASREMLRRIKSINYTVIVPQQDYHLFLGSTPSQFQVIPEEDLVSREFIRQLRAKTVVSCHGAPSYGWYLHQFLKLSALEKISPSEIGLIWDADTIPLRPLIFEQNNKLIYYKGFECHEPYFKVIRDLLDLEKINNFSFIAQCFPCKGRWLKDFINHVEQRSGKNWKYAILDCIDFDEQSGFSEYETLGTFIYKSYPDQISVINNSWCRRGNGLIGGIENLKFFGPFLKFKYDFISFEDWDRPYSRFF